MDIIVRALTYNISLEMERNKRKSDWKVLKANDALLLRPLMAMLDFTSLVLLDNTHQIGPKNKDGMTLGLLTEVSHGSTRELSMN